MKATDLIASLKRIVADHGDCDVALLECSSFALTPLDPECVGYDDEAKAIVLGSPDQAGAA